MLMLLLYDFIDMQCDPLESIAHGTSVIIPYNKFAAIAKYECDEGYEMIGRDRRVRVCQGDGKWSLSAPECRINMNQSLGRYQSVARVQ